MAAYTEVCNSRFVVSGEWDKPRNPNDKGHWDPKPQDREAYVKYMKDVIERPPITSPYNAVMVFFAGNGGCSCVERIVVAYQSQRAQKQFWSEVHKLNNADREQVMRRNNSDPVNIDIPPRDPKERPIDRPFVRPKPIPGDIKISESNWHRYENIGHTFFVKDEDDETDYTAFELAGILIHETGIFYKIRYENNVDSIQITQRELFGMIEDGIWV